MDSRNPSDKKRRTIEGLLSSKNTENSSEESDDLITREISESEMELDDELEISAENKEDQEQIHLMEDEYEPTDILDEADEYEEVATPRQEMPGNAPENSDESRQNNSNLIKYVAIAIVVIGISAAGLILVRDHIYSFFSSFGGGETEEVDQSELIKELQAENDRLGNMVADSEKDSVEIRNLRTANSSLQSMLDVEKEKNERLTGELKESSPQIDKSLELEEGEMPDDAQEKGEIKILRQQLEDEITRGDDLAEQLQGLNRRMINYSRENSRLNQELGEAKEDVNDLQYLKRDNSKLRNQKETLSRQLRTANSQIEVLQSAADDNSDSSTQLEKVNLEYRRVLDLLQESRDANNGKQRKVDELLAENTRLQAKVNRFEKNQNNITEKYVSNSNYGDRSSRSSDSGIVAPYPIDIVRPKYPNSAWRRKVGGVVTLRVYITKYGDVSEAKVVSSPDRLRSLDKAALSAVKQWKFMPGKRNGRPIDMWHDVPWSLPLPGKIKRVTKGNLGI